MPDSRERTKEDLERIEKLAEWRGSVTTTLDAIKEELNRLYAYNKEFETVNAKVHIRIEQIIRDAIKNLDDSMDEKLKEERRVREEAGKIVCDKVNRANRRVNNLYFKLGFINGTIAFIVTALTMLISAWIKG